MNSKVIVENIEKYCKLKGVKPTPACRDSGAGPNFLQDIRGEKDISARRLTMLAEYLGVTTSDLLGEKNPAGDEASGQTEEGATISGFIDLTPERQELVRQHVALLLAEQQKD